MGAALLDWTAKNWQQRLIPCGLAGETAYLF
jgi:hypothetical protein